MNCNMGECYFCFTTFRDFFGFNQENADSYTKFMLSSWCIEGEESFSTTNWRYM